MTAHLQVEEYNDSHFCMQKLARGSIPLCIRIIFGSHFQKDEGGAVE